MTETPAPECTPACTEQHTYLLGTCALSCTEIKGSVAHPAWVVACPKCKARPDQPCLRGDGTPSGIVHEVRCEALDACRQPPTPAPAEARTADGEGELAVRGVQAWMALDLHMALGHPFDPRADVEHQGHKSWADWWATLCAEARQLAGAKQYERRLAEAVPTDQDVRDFIHELNADPDPQPVAPEFFEQLHRTTAREDDPAPLRRKPRLQGPVARLCYTVDTITSNALDQLYEQLEQQTAKAGDVAEWFKEQRRRAEQAEAANERLRDLLGEAVGWIHEGELRDRICAVLNGREERP